MRGRLNSYQFEFALIVEELRVDETITSGAMLYPERVK